MAQLVTVRQVPFICAHLMWRARAGAVVTSDVPMGERRQGQGSLG